MTVATILVIAAALAAYLPARGVTRIDPMPKLAGVTPAKAASSLYATVVVELCPRERRLGGQKLTATRHRLSGLRDE